jgi:hypothetical protein
MTIQRPPPTQSETRRVRKVAPVVGESALRTFTKLVLGIPLLGQK